MGVSWIPSEQLILISKVTKNHSRQEEAVCHKLLVDLYTCSLSRQKSSFHNLENPKNSQKQQQHVPEVNRYISMQKERHAPKPTATLHLFLVRKESCRTMQEILELRLAGWSGEAWLGFYVTIKLEGKYYCSHWANYALLASIRQH